MTCFKGQQYCIITYCPRNIACNCKQSVTWLKNKKNKNQNKLVKKNIHKMFPVYWRKHVAKQVILLLFFWAVKRLIHNQNNSKDGCFGVVCLFVVSSASTKPSRQIASAPAVRDDLVFTASRQWKVPLTKCSRPSLPPAPSLHPPRWEDVQVRPVRLHLQEEGHAQRAHPGGARRPQEVQVRPVWEGLRHSVGAQEPQEGELGKNTPNPFRLGVFFS